MLSSPLWYFIGYYGDNTSNVNDIPELSTLIVIQISVIFVFLESAQIQYIWFNKKMKCQYNCGSWLQKLQNYSYIILSRIIPICLYAMLKPEKSKIYIYIYTFITLRTSILLSRQPSGFTSRRICTKTKFPITGVW